MLKHILIVKSDGGFLYSKCYAQECRLDNVSSPEAYQLFKTLKSISTEKPSSKVKTIIFEEMKLIVEARSEICVFFEVDLKAIEKKVRPVIVNIADQINTLFQQSGEDTVKQRITSIMAKIKP